MSLEITAVFALAAIGCSGPEIRPAPQPATAAIHGEQEATQAVAGSDNTKTQDNIMNNGARSPAGETHPGQIVHDDKVDGRTWTRAAVEVPMSIAWVELNGTWTPVVRIEITGTPAQRRITKFGTDGRMLESTIQAPPPPAPR